MHTGITPSRLFTMSGCIVYKEGRGGATNSKCTGASFSPPLSFPLSCRSSVYFSRQKPTPLLISPPLLLLPPPPFRLQADSGRGAESPTRGRESPDRTATVAAAHFIILGSQGKWKKLWRGRARRRRRRRDLSVYCGAGGRREGRHGTVQRVLARVFPFPLLPFPFSARKRKWRKGGKEREELEERQLNLVN